MPDDRHHEKHCRPAVEGAPDREAALPTEEEGRDPALVIAQGEAGDDEGAEGNGEERVLDHLVDVHAQQLRALAGDVHQVADEVDDPVQDHEADDDGDGDDVDLLDHVRDRRPQPLTADAVDRV